MTKLFMSCGHTSQGYDTNTGESVCIICQNYEKSSALPDLTGREAKCFYKFGCNKKEKSSFDLPFFKFDAKNNYDEYYCGCRGWD